MSNVSMRKKKFVWKIVDKLVCYTPRRVIKHFSPQFRVAKFRPRKIFIFAKKSYTA